MGGIGIWPLGGSWQPADHQYNKVLEVTAKILDLCQSATVRSEIPLDTGNP
jgi:hypothetical protein